MKRNAWKKDDGEIAKRKKEQKGEQEQKKKEQGQEGAPTLPLRTAPPPRELSEASVALWLINSSLTNPTRDDILAFGATKEFSVARTKILAELRARGLTRVFEEIERPLIPVTEAMNARGVMIDRPYLSALSKEYHRELSALERGIFELADGEFNLNSPKQLGEALFVKMGLRALRQKKTALGAPSTRESELEKLREAHPIIGKILEYREFQKLLSTYIDNIPKMVAEDGRLHAEFVQAGTTTGRMASKHPNLQNIPIQTDRGRRIRNSFVAEKGFVLLALDYSQMELRIAAMLSGDEKLIHIFQAGEDVHTSVAAYVFRVGRDEIT
ncbi:MAG: DNA polymerase I, partial [Parcubacteria group bacterium Greene0416_79]